MTAAREERVLVLRWRNAVFVVFGLVGVLFATWASRLPALRDLLDASNEEIGVLLLGLASGSILGLLASSHVVARIGASRAVVLAFAIACVGLGLIGVASAVLPLVWSVLLAALVLGAGTSVTDVAMNVSGAAAERALGRTVMPLFHAAFSLGTVVGVLIGAGAETLGVPVAVHLLAVAVAGICAVVVAGRRLRPAAPDASEGGGDAGPRGWRGRLAVFREPGTLLIGLVALGWAFAEGTANDWLALAMVDGHGLDNSAGAVVLGVFLAAMTAGRVAGTPLLDRFGRVPVLLVCTVLAFVGLLLVIATEPLPVVVAGVVLWGVGASLGLPVAMSAAADDPQRAAARVSAVATIGYGAFLVGPPVIGLLGERIGILQALVVALALIVVAGAASGALRRPPTGPAQSASPATSERPAAD